MLIRTANVLRRLDERWTDGDENRKLRALSAPASPPSRRFQTMWGLFSHQRDSLRERQHCQTHFFWGEAVLMMELPKRHSTPSEGGRFAPIKSSGYGGRPLTGPRPDDLLELRLVEWSGWVNE